MTRAASELVSTLTDGGRLTVEERRAVLDIRDPITLGLLADAVRRRRHAAGTTFVRVAEAGLEDRPDEWQPGTVGEWRVVGTMMDPAAAGRVVEAVVRRAGGLPVSGFSLADLEAWCGARARPLVDLLHELRGRGLERIAEAPMDELARPELAFEAVKEAALGVERITLAGLVDDWPVLVARLDSVRRATGPLGRLAPLPRRLEPDAATGYDDVRQIARACVLADSVDSIQVDWTLHGPKLAQVALAFGADDIDAVVPPETPDQSPRRALVAEIRRNIEAAGLDPFERNGRSELLDP